MEYAFSCITCEHRESYFFPVSEYDQHVHTREDGKDGLHRTELCPKCGTKTMYRHISADTMPHVMGGSNSYKSMERYWSENPGLRRKHEDALAAGMEERHRKRVTDHIDKQTKRSGKGNRHKGYGEGQSETRLKSDD